MPPDGGGGSPCAEKAQLAAEKACSKDTNLSTGSSSQRLRLQVPSSPRDPNLDQTLESVGLGLPRDPSPHPTTTSSRAGTSVGGFPRTPTQGTSIDRAAYTKNATNAVVHYHAARQAERSRVERSWTKTELWRRARSIVDHEYFSLIVGAVIIVNSVIIYFETEGYLGDGVGSLSWILELLFLLFYISETGLRLAGFGPARFSSDSWNILDLLLVMVSMLDILILSPLRGTDESSVFFIMVVVLRLMRIFRLIRVLRLVRPLYLMVCGIKNSVRAIAWSVMLVVVVIFLFSLAMAHTLQPALREPPEQWSMDMRPYFGTISSTMFTMFQIMTYDDWPTIVRGAWELNRLSMLIIMCFLCCTSLSVLNVVMGIFVEGTISAARKNDDEKAMQIRRNHKKLYDDFEKLFHTADTDGSGHLTREELMTAMEEEEFQLRLMNLKITRGDICMLFDSLDLQGADSVNAREFIECLLCASNAASKKELLALSLIVRRSSQATQNLIGGITKDCEERLSDSQRRLAALSADATRLAKLATERAEMRAACQ